MKPFDRAIAALVLAIGMTVNAVAAGEPPQTPVRPVIDTYWGTPVVDDYRYLESLQDPEVMAWIRAQADYTRAALDRLPGRKALLQRIHELANTDELLYAVVRRGQRFFSQRIAPGEQQTKLYVRDTLAGKDRLLIDPTRTSAAVGSHYALDYFVPSWDGKRVVYGISAGGSEASTLHVLDVDTGKVLSESITRTDLDVIGWRADSQSFFYFRFNAPVPGAPASDLVYNARTYLHQIGAHPTGDGDVSVFGHNVSTMIEVPEGQATYVYTASESAYVMAAANHNLDNSPSTFYVAKGDELNGAHTPWRRFATVEDGITQVIMRGDTLYYLTLAGAPRFRIMAVDLAHPELASAREIVPQGVGVITDFGIAKDGLYYRVRDGSTARIVRVDFAGKNALVVPLAVAGNVEDLVTDSASVGILYGFEGWISPYQHYFYDADSSLSHASGLLPLTRVDTSGFVAEEVQVTSHDGTRVPLSILHRSDLKRDGLAPTIINGYGAYGAVSEASFSPILVAWLERGGVYVIAHVRGGGELGGDWHQAGFQRSKPNTWLDFIACSEYLVDAHYTSKSKLGGTGTSAGGILIGNAMTRRPDLYRVIIDRVGMSDLNATRLNRTVRQTFPKWVL